MGLVGAKVSSTRDLHGEKFGSGESESRILNSPGIASAHQKVPKAAVFWKFVDGVPEQAFDKVLRHAPPLFPNGEGFQFDDLIPRTFKHFEKMFLANKAKVIGQIERPGHLVG